MLQKVLKARIGFIKNQLIDYSPILKAQKNHSSITQVLKGIMTWEKATKHSRALES